LEKMFVELGKLFGMFVVLNIEEWGVGGWSRDGGEGVSGRDGVLDFLERWLVEEGVVREKGVFLDMLRERWGLG
ncbi:hypothetical protein, partial [Paenibacillus xylanexedens]|uniref:hypothetical protein n=1 Tax=Paenibacillus xylanexedens TaxID=528191 RepID=UPI00164357DF